MFKYDKTFSGFSVNDIQKAKEFYSDTLDVEVREEGKMGLSLQLKGGTTVFIYPKKDHQPATFTVLNFIVDNIDDAMEILSGEGVQFERYDSADLPQDEKGVLRGLKAGMGPDIAWFKDPAGNVLSVLQEN
ncbi:MAG: VOC family protein [Balneolaceae bacterium]